MSMSTKISRMKTPISGLRVRDWQPQTGHGPPALLFFAMSLCLLLALSFSRTENEPKPDPDVARLVSLKQSRVCQSLSASLPNLVYSDHHHPVFGQSRKESYAVQAQQETPTCIVRPTLPQDVSIAVKVLRAAYNAGEDARFAVRSGGHFPGRGHSSIDHGVLIDLSLINEVVVEDTSNVLLGVGSRWGPVYRKLDAMGLAVAGGRDAGVGVGGFLLGGGISYFAPRFGLACDDVLEYEVVVADGTILHVSNSTHADLFKSLKGGSGNFGIVTRVRMKTFLGGDVWGGYVLSPWSHLMTIVAAFHTFLKREIPDELAAGPVVSLAYVQDFGIMAIGSSIVHTAPSEWPPIWQDYKKDWGLWSWTSLKRRSLWDLSQDLHSKTRGDKRQLYATITIKNDLETLIYASSMLPKYRSRMRSIKSLLMALALQPLPYAGVDNVLGLKPRSSKEGAPVVLLLCPSWKRESDDALVQKIVYDMLEDIKQYASQHGSSEPYVYLNYAAYWQDPITSYGDQNKAFLQAVSLKYDPTGFWQRAKEGGFGLGLYEAAKQRHVNNATM